MPKGKKKGKDGTKGSVRRNRRADAGGKKTAIPVSFQSGERALIERVSRAPDFQPRKCLQIQDLMYNTAHELQSLAFKSGFNLGAEVYRNSDRSFAPLEHVLENAGLGKIVYYPFESRSVLTSRSVKPNGIELGTNVHIFEAGIMSGYLSAHAGKSIVVQEQTCVFNGASACEFMASAGEIGSGEHRQLEFSGVLRALSKAIADGNACKIDDAYYLLAIKPLITEPVLGEAKKFLYITGKMLAKELPAFDRSVSGAACLLGIEKAEIIRDRKKNLSVDLSFTKGTSINGFVEFSVAMIAGMMKGKFGKNVDVKRNKDREGFYKVRLQLVSDLAR